MKSLFRSYHTQVDKAYIITVMNNVTSMTLAQRCAQSCEQVNMSYQLWPAFDGTTSAEIQTPPHLQSCTFLPMIKIMDNYLTKAEVALALSHISLWTHCVLIDKPIVILEHDAVMIKPFSVMKGYNTIVYLGCREWAQEGWPMSYIPLHGSDGPNKHFICRAHAYAIDPAVAKNMLAQTLKMGIYASLDEMIYADLYNISHDGVYAYDASGSKHCDQ